MNSITSSTRKAMTEADTLAEHLPAMRDAVDRHQAIEVATMSGEILIDVQTAAAVLQVRDALKESNRSKFDAMPVDRAGLIAWRLLDKVNAVAA